MPCFGTKIFQIGMIPHNITSFKSTRVLYQFHRQTLPITKIDQGQIQLREYDSTGTEPMPIADTDGHIQPVTYMYTNGPYLPVTMRQAYYARQRYRWVYSTLHIH